MRYLTRIKDIEEFKISYRNLSTQLTDLGHFVVLVGNVPIFNYHAEKCLYGSSEQIEKYCSLSLKEWNRQKAQYEDYLIKLSDELPNVFFLEIGSEFCGANNCRMLDNSNNILFRDNDHLNILGSNKIGHLISSFAENLVSNSP
jgi:hypothetical protein